MMPEECHAHIFMDGVNYQAAARRYSSGVDEDDIRRKLSAYKDAGIDYVRDGGDHYGAAKRASQLAPEYGIEYRMPVFAIHRKGQYGAIVGRNYETMQEYHNLVLQVKAQGGDFIKVMFSGIMDFASDGAVTGRARSAMEIREMVHIAHEEGFAVMAHVNGDAAVMDAIEAGTDSIEHGNFMKEETLHALAESSTVWVPTVTTIGALVSCDRYDTHLMQALYRRQFDNVRTALRLGASVACGSDAGAYGVPHVTGLSDEMRILGLAAEGITGAQERIALAGQIIRHRFRTDFNCECSI